MKLTKSRDYIDAYQIQVNSDLSTQICSFLPEPVNLQPAYMGADTFNRYIREDGHDYRRGIGRRSGRQWRGVNGNDSSDDDDDDDDNDNSGADSANAGAKRRKPTGSAKILPNGYLVRS